MDGMSGTARSGMGWLVPGTVAAGLAIRKGVEAIIVVLIVLLVREIIRTVIGQKTILGELMGKEGKKNG